VTSSASPSATRSSRAKAAAVSLATALALSACGGSPPAGEQTQKQLSEGQLLSVESADGHRLREVPAQQAPTVSLEVTEDPASGWNVHVVTGDFQFAPERLGQVRPQEGHAHLFLDGEKIARLYGAWYHLSDARVPAGKHELSVSLNANDHTVWAVDGEAIKATTTVTGSEDSGHTHGEGHDHGHGHGDESETGTADEGSTPGDSAGEGPSFVVSDGEVEGPRQVAVNVGEEVVFTVETDTVDEVHVHGYDMTVPVKPGEAATIRLRADIPGVFEVELEEAHLQLTQLRVSP
jgi:hypothetical protein